MAALVPLQSLLDLESQNLPSNGVSSDPGRNPSLQQDPRYRCFLNRIFEERPKVFGTQLFVFGLSITIIGVVMLRSEDLDPRTAKVLALSGVVLAFFSFAACRLVPQRRSP